SYKSSLWVECGDRRANAKSLLGVLSLGITKGTRINIVADGADEADAIEGLSNLILTGFID
ncbi:MAG: HPr family phosphocarrier protein, partial [Clostridia bacterium]|nr:HPr family phosphocarrier protein [Clostridia bacterium]